MIENLVGRTIGKYRILERLGHGGMADVYRAYQASLDRDVALKVLHPYLMSGEEDFVGRFRREARAAAALRHPNIVQVFDFDHEDGLYYMVMECIDGQTLKQRLKELRKRGRVMSLEETLHILEHIGDALDYAHQQGMLHRDIKPSNIMITSKGRAVLTDFGIVRMIGGTRHTMTGSVTGTPAYMSPEQGLGEPGDARSDIYSLGVMLFQMTTGKLPYDADTPLAVVLKHVNNPLPIPRQINDSIPRSVERVIFKTLAKDPDSRYQSAEELVQHLEQIKAGLTVPEVEGSVTTPPPRPIDRVDAATVYAPPVAPPTIQGRQRGTGTGTAAIAQRPSRRWLLPVIGFAAVAIVALVVAILALDLPSLWTESPATPTQAAIIVPTPPEPTNTPPPTNTLPPTNTPPPSPTSLDPVFAAQTALALQNATLTAMAPTLTPTPSSTPAPSVTPTPACDYAYDVVSFFTYGNSYNYNSSRNQTVAPVNSRFALTIQLQNSSGCAWDAGTSLSFLEGESLGASQPMVLDQPVQPEEVASFDTTMSSGSQSGLQVSTWSLELPDGTRIEPPFELRISIYIPATATPTAAPEPTAEPTSEVSGPIDFNWFLSDCQYAGDQWRCLMTLTPFGGIGQPYTFWVRDSEPPARYYGGNQYHWIQSRRCSAWIHEITLQDDGGNSTNKNIYISPDNYFAGGCTLP